jgi:lincosamide nucleotidyltransferase A/C/D/E
VPSSTPVGASTTATDVLAVLDVADESAARLWIDGGWGVDALLGAQTREHGDLDVAVEQHHLERLVRALERAGYARAGEPGAAAWNFLLRHPAGPCVDLHAIVLDAAGNGVLGPPEAGNAYPAASLTGRGTIAGRPVDCVSAEWVVRFHDAYTGDATDRADVLALCERFGLDVPAQYAVG